MHVCLRHNIFRGLKRVLTNAYEFAFSPRTLITRGLSLSTATRRKIAIVKNSLVILLTHSATQSNILTWRLGRGHTIDSLKSRHAFRDNITARWSRRTWMAIQSPFLQTARRFCHEFSTVEKFWRRAVKTALAHLARSVPGRATHDGRDDHVSFESVLFVFY